MDDKNEVMNIGNLKSSHELCALLLKTPHYKKMGEEGIFAVVETAKALGVDPRLALMGGLYYVKGKVEMSARQMNALIRSHKHSISKDENSTDKICILHGTRADNGDKATTSFRIEEAQRAGLIKDLSAWRSFPEDMLFARALSRLGRQLFPDVIGNCYVAGEIADDSNIQDVTPKPQSPQKPIEVSYDAEVTDEELEELTALADSIPEITIEQILAWAQVADVTLLTREKFDVCLLDLRKRLDKFKEQMES